MEAYALGRSPAAISDLENFAAAKRRVCECFLPGAAGQSGRTFRRDSRQCGAGSQDTKPLHGEWACEVGPTLKAQRYLS